MVALLAANTKEEQIGFVWSGGECGTETHHTLSAQCEDRNVYEWMEKFENGQRERALTWSSRDESSKPTSDHRWGDHGSAYEIIHDKVHCCKICVCQESLLKRKPTVVWRSVKAYSTGQQETRPGKGVYSHQCSWKTFFSDGISRRDFIRKWCNCSTLLLFQ